VHIIYLGLLTRRVPILGPFAPTHVGSPNSGSIPFGDLYDIECLASKIAFPVIEWRDVKRPLEPGQQPEPLGGWTVWARVDSQHSAGEGRPRHNQVTPLGECETLVGVAT
jgi:hypothetical protein